MWCLCMPLTSFPLSPNTLPFYRRFTSPLTESLRYRRSLQFPKDEHPTLFPNDLRVSKGFADETSVRTRNLSNRLLGPGTQNSGTSLRSNRSKGKFSRGRQQDTNQRFACRWVAAISNGAKRPTKAPRLAHRQKQLAIPHRSLTLFTRLTPSLLSSESPLQPCTRHHAPKKISYYTVALSHLPVACKSAVSNCPISIIYAYRFICKYIDHYIW